MSFNLTMITSGEKFLQVKVIKCPFNSTRQGDIYSNPSLNLKVTWTQADVVVINHASHLCYVYKLMLCVGRLSVDLNPISRVFSGHSGFLPHQNRLIKF